MKPIVSASRLILFAIGLAASGAPRVPARFSYPAASKKYLAPLRAASSLSGTVVREGSTEPLPRVLVERMDGTFSKRLDACFSDSLGQFHLKNNMQGVHHLRFSLFGYDTVQFDVELERRSTKTMTVELPLGT